MSSPHSEEAGSSGQADALKAAAGAEATNSDDLVGVAQPDIQQQQETWVKYTTLQEGQWGSFADRLVHCNTIHALDGLCLKQVYVVDIARPCLSAASYLACLHRQPSLCRSGGSGTVFWLSQQQVLANLTWLMRYNRSTQHNRCQLRSGLCKPQPRTTDLLSRRNSSSLHFWLELHSCMEQQSIP